MTTRQSLAEGVGISFEQFWDRFIRVDIGGRLVKPVPHREQLRYIRWVDQRAEIDRWRALWEAFLAWRRKASKSTTAGARGFHHLAADELVTTDRLVGLAASDELQARIIYRVIQQFIERDPYWAKRIQIGRNEMVYKERVRDERTGGIFTREHLLRALPRDLKGSHGEPWSMIIRDELWTEPNHDFSEALVISPTRVGGEILYCSYYPPNTMMRPGVPFYDLMQRVKAGDPSLFYSYLGGSNHDGPDKIVPWLTDEWIAHQEKILASSPARFRRMILNVPAGIDDGLITAAELRDALQAMREPDEAEPGITYWCAADLGVVFDWTCVLVGHLDARNRLVLDVVRLWRGTHQEPVSLVEIQDEIAALHQRFHFERVHIDQWQARHMVEQLQHLRVPAEIITLDGGTLDRLVTQIKSAFTRRLMVLPDRHPEVVEQLESVKAVEAGRRRDLLKFQPGETAGNDASAHDDIAVCLAMLLDMAWPNVGRNALPETFNLCLRQLNMPNTFPSAAACFVVGPGHFIPPFNDAICRECVGLRAVRDAYERHKSGKDAEPMSIRTFRRTRMENNEFCARMNFRETGAEDWYL